MLENAMLQRRHLLMMGALAPGLVRAQASDKPPRWVVVLLRGAVDGLSVCAPYADADYREARPNIALGLPGSEDGAIDLDGRFGLHPALGSLLPLWQAGQFGFVQACGAPKPNRSHFEAQDELEAGTPGVKTTGDGWLGRMLATRDDAAAVHALYTGANRPKLLSGSPAAVAALTGGRAAARNERGQRPALAEGLDKLYAQDPKYAAAWAAAQQGREQVQEALQAGAMQPAMQPNMRGGNDMLNREMQAADRGAPAPGSFPDSARRLAQAMRADARLQFAVLELGGWDTHARQGAGRGQLAGRLQPLGEGLALLARELGGIWDNTVVTVVSEFGRTVKENGTAGTDHGHGNALWMLGGSVAGGKVHGRWPGLEMAARQDGRDLAVTTDYRSVMAGVAARHLGLRDAALAGLFPGFEGKTVNLLRA